MNGVVNEIDQLDSSVSVFGPSKQTHRSKPDRKFKSPWFTNEYEAARCEQKTTKKAYKKVTSRIEIPLFRNASYNSELNGRRDLRFQKKAKKKKKKKKKKIHCTSLLRPNL